MKRVFFVCLLLGLFVGSTVWALTVEPVGVYWDLQATYGSGDDVLDSASDTYLVPSLPHAYTVPRAGDVEVYDNNELIYAYAGFAAGADTLYAEASGFADPSYSSLSDWFKASSRAAVASNPFSGSLDFDYEANIDYGAGSQGKVGYAIAIIDWSETTNPADPVIIHDERVFLTDSASSHYSNVWTSLDPSHYYILGIGVLASVEGEEDAYGGEVSIELTRITTTAVPEPTTVALLVGGGLILFAWRRRR